MERLVVAALVVLTVAVRVPTAVHDPLWLDEVVAARVVTQPGPSAAVSQLRRTESSPPAWYAVVWGTRALSGWHLSMRGLRLLSILFSACATAIVVLFARRLLPLWAAALAGFVVAASPGFVEHGSELRAYALLALLAGIFGLTLADAVARPTRRRLAVLAAVVALGALTHYFFLIGVGAGLLWLWLPTSPRAPRLRVSAAVLAGLLPFLAWVPILRYQYHHKLYGFIGPFKARTVAYSYARIFGVFGSSGAPYLAARAAVLLLVLGGAGWLVARRGRELGDLVAVLAVVPVVVTAILWALGANVFLGRNLLVAGPFAAIAAAAGVASLPRRLSAVGALAVVAGVSWSLGTFELHWGRAPYDRMAGALVAEGWTDDANLVYFGPAAGGTLGPVGWYLPGRPLLLPRSRATPGAAVYVVSYDEGAGPSWLRRRRSAVATARTFPAYDHTPRGPRAHTPITVARIDPRLVADALVHGGHVYRARLP